MRECQKYIRQSKITISMPGCGVKCFRHGENCQDAIMAFPIDSLAWSYPWTEQNSIRFIPFGAFAGSIHRSIENSNLYELYCAATENGRNYRPETYLRRWVLANIERNL